MSESCKYCSVYPRNPCRNTKEAADCPNCANAASYLDFDPIEVAAWLRYKVRYSSDQHVEAIEAVAVLLETKLRYA